MIKKGNILEKLFGSQTRVRALRLFLLNPEEVFDVKTLARRLRAGKHAVKKELRLLLDVGYIHKGAKAVDITRRGIVRRKKIVGHILDRSFPYLNELAELLASNTPYAREKLASGLRGVGKVNVLVIAGRLLGYDRDHVDILLVGEALRKSKIENILGNIEAEVGRELVYAIMATKEFQYRYAMQDRFIRELFNNPHEVLVSKLDIIGR